MAHIVQRLFERRLQIGAEQVLLPLQMSWQKIRIGLRSGISRAPSFPAPGAFIFGLCTGAKGWADSDCTDFVGIMAAGSGGPFGTDWVLTSTGSLPGYYTVGTGIGYHIRKLNGVSTAVNQGGGTAQYWAAAPNNSFEFIDITRGSPNYTFQLWGATITSANQNNLVSTFYAALENESTPGSSVQSIRSYTVAETGIPVWDHVCFSWNRSIPTVEIAQIAAVRFL